MKNKIINISGQPITEKSTKVNDLTNELKEKGYNEEKIHIISAEEKFREYSNLVAEIMNSLDDPEKSNKLYENEKVSNVMKDKELRSAFIKSLVQIKDAKIDPSKLTIEQANNLKEFEAVREVIDKLVDTEIKNLGVEINEEERPEDVWIIDSGLTLHNIPDSFSVRLTNDIDLEDEKNYNLIIDTSYSDNKDISNTIVSCLDRYIENKRFTKNWTSPKKLLPLQGIMDTVYGVNEVADSIKKKGFLPDQGIEVVDVDGYKFIIEGHHRNFAAPNVGKSLVPYEVIGKDDDRLYYGGATARERVGHLDLSTVYDHEGLISRNFRYTDVYPNVYEFIKEQNQKIKEKLSKKKDEQER